MNERKTKRAALPPRARSGAAAQREAQSNAQTNAQSSAGNATDKVTIASLLEELEEARKIAIAKKQPAPAIAAILAKAKIAGFADDKLDTASASAAPRPGQYADAVRRISYLLRQQAVEKRNEGKT